MLRKLVAASFVLSAVLLGLPASGVTPPRPSLPILIWPTGVDAGCYLFISDKPPTGPLGYSATFENQDSKTRTIAQRDGFWNFKVAPDASKSVKGHAAGSYIATCDGQRGTVVLRIKITAPSQPSTPTFTLTWADSLADASWTYDVQYRVGTGAWQSWKHGTTKRSAPFSGVSGKTYSFQARTTSAGGTTNWSLPRTVMT